MKANKTNKTGFSGMGFLTARILFLTLFGFPARLLAQDANVDVDKYKDDLSRQIDQIKVQTPIPQPTPEAKGHKAKKEAAVPTPKPVEEKKDKPATEPKAKKKETALENTDLDQLKATVALLSQKVDSLGGQGTAFKFSLLLQGRGTINDKPTVKISGNTVYEGLDDSTVPGTVNDQLYLRRSEMKFYGGFSNNALQYVVMIDPVGVPAATKNLVQDCFLMVSPLKCVDFTFGQTKYPQGLEARTSSSKLEFINRSTLGGGNGFGDQRDLLAQISGSKVPIAQDLTLDYALAAVNGQGRNNPENNNNKDGAARLGFQYQNLWIGGSAYDGFEQAQGVTKSLEMWRVGLEAQWVLEGLFAPKDNLKLQAEYGQGSLVNENGTTKGAFSAASGGTGASGFYAEGLYRRDNTRVGVRYEFWDPRDTAFASPGYYQNYLTLGADQFFFDDHYRVSVNWIHPILDSRAGGILSVGEVAEAQMQLAF